MSIARYFQFAVRKVRIVYQPPKKIPERNVVATGIFDAVKEG